MVGECRWDVGHLLIVGGGRSNRCGAGGGIGINESPGGDPPVTGRVPREGAGEGGVRSALGEGGRGPGCPISCLGGRFCVFGGLEVEKVTVLVLWSVKR